MRAVMGTYLMLALSGCVLHDNLVRCHRRLEPINTPMPRAAHTAEPASSGESDTARSDHE
jgi:hypothetical protein